MISAIRFGFYFLLIFIFLLTTNSCAKEEAPYQLSDEKLTEIITDIHISESATQHLSLAFRDSMVLIYLDQILEIHGVTKDVFEPDYEKLKRDPKKLQLVYAKIIDRLNKLKIKKKEDKKEEKKLTDKLKSTTQNEPSAKKK